MQGGAFPSDPISLTKRRESDEIDLVVTGSEAAAIPSGTA